MNHIDWWLLLGAIVACLFAAILLLRDYMPVFRPDKSLDLLEKRDALTQSLLVLGIQIPTIVMIGIFSVVSCFSWLVIQGLYPNATTSAVIVAIVIFVSQFILVVDIGSMRLAKFEYAFLAFIETVHACLSTGMSFQSAFQFAHEHSDGAVFKETGKVLQRLSISSDVEPCFNPLITKYNCETVRLFCHSVVTYSESHCDLQDMLKELSLMMSTRTLEKQKIKAKLAGTKYAAIFSGLLPYSLIPLFGYQDPTWFQPLLQHPNGSAFITAAVLCQLFGLLWLRLSLRVSI